MIEMHRTQYVPDNVSAPGESLLEVLSSKGMSQAELAERTGRPKKTINEIVKGKAAITPETAIQLERVLGIPAEYWNNRERLYREAIARRNDSEQIEGSAEWAKLFPCAAMEKFGWIRQRQDKAGRVDELLTFFRVASPHAWKECWRQPQVAFKQSSAFEPHFGAVAAWLRRGEIEAEDVQARPYDAVGFTDCLTSIRALTRSDSFHQQLVEMCAANGVVVVLVPEIPGTHVWGATRWLGVERALIQLSLRYKTDDHFWFSFFHEAGHVLLHGKRQTFIELDAGRRGSQSDDEKKKEDEADAFAREQLIPEATFKSFLRRRVFACSAIRQFAFEIGVSPGVVVGRLQHDELLPRVQCNELKRSVTFRP